MKTKLSNTLIFILGVLSGLVLCAIFVLSFPFGKPVCVNPTSHEVTYKLVDEFHKLYYFAQYDNDNFVKYTTKTTNQVDSHIYYACSSIEEFPFFPLSKK